MAWPIGVGRQCTGLRGLESAGARRGHLEIIQPHLARAQKGLVIYEGSHSEEPEPPDSVSLASFLPPQPSPPSVVEWPGQRPAGWVGGTYFTGFYKEHHDFQVPHPSWTKFKTAHLTESFLLLCARGGPAAQAHEGTCQVTRQAPGRAGNQNLHSLTTQLSLAGWLCF